MNLQALRNILIPLAFILKWTGENECRLVFRSSDMSLATLALQVAFSDIKQAHSVKFWRATKLFIKQCYGNFLKAIFMINLCHLFLSYGKIFSCFYQTMTNKWEKKTSTPQIRQDYRITYLSSVQMTQCSYIHLAHINCKLSSQQRSNNRLCLFNVVSVLLHVFHASVSRGLKKNDSSFHLSEVNFSDEPRAQAVTK